MTSHLLRDRIPAKLACLVLFAGTGAALGDDGLMITINNDTSDNLLVTAYDRSTNPPQQVLSGRAIYGNASFVVSISADQAGQGSLSWTAVTADRDMRKCGHQTERGLNAGDTVRVRADGECSN